MGCLGLGMGRWGGRGGGLRVRKRRVGVEGGRYGRVVPARLADLLSKS